MKRYSNKTKKSSRKNRLKTLRNRDEEFATIPESSVKNDRIKSAIEKGAESVLPSDTTTGHCLKKFEHNGKEGPLVVYAEDRKMFNEYGHFTVITSFKPSDSLRNQLFFGSRSSIPGNVSTSEHEMTQTRSVDLTDDIRKEPKSSRQKNNNGDAPRQKHRQPSSFEGLVTRYKNRQDKYRRLLGDDARYLFQKIDNLCTTKTNAQEETQKPRDVDSKLVKPVLPKITVDKTTDKPLMVEESSNLIQLSRRKRKPRLPHLTVPRYSAM